MNGLAPLRHVPGPAARLACRRQGGDGLTVVFLGGFRSAMSGLKACAIERWCARRGLASLCLDYAGHGQSGGRFEDGCVSAWAADARAVIEQLAGERVLLVGSSMGAWIMTLLADQEPGRPIAGLLGLACAPDFTEQSLWARLPPAAREALMTSGMIEVPSSYGDGPYPITRTLVEDGRRHRVLDRRIAAGYPVRLLHGLADTDVPWQLSVRLADVFEGADVRVELLKGAGHRLSEPAELDRILALLDELCTAAAPA